MREKLRQTVVGSANGHADNTVSCHHIMKHDVLLEKGKKKKKDRKRTEREKKTLETGKSFNLKIKYNLLSLKKIMFYKKN